MFSSLDRADIVLQPGPDGRQEYVQTDHRTAAEIEQEPELSVVFALIRVRNPKRMAAAGSPEPVVIYSAFEPPPEFLRRAIHAAGGKLMVGDDRRLLPEPPDLPRFEDLLATAFAVLARAVAADYGVAVTPDGLRVVEQALAEFTDDPDEGEVGYWSAVVKLGSFGGEVIRAGNGGRWVATDMGSLPFALATRFRGGDGTVNPLGKAIKRFENGEEDSVGSLVHVLLSEP